MARFHLTNGKRIQFTPEEETARDAEEAQAVIDKQARDDAIAQEATDAKAGNDKLVELGLSQDQVTAMTGYTPPAE